MVKYRRKTFQIHYRTPSDSRCSQRNTLQPKTNWTMMTPTVCFSRPSWSNSRNSTNSIKEYWNKDRRIRSKRGRNKAIKHTIRMWRHPLSLMMWIFQVVRGLIGTRRRSISFMTTALERRGLYAAHRPRQSRWTRLLVEWPWNLPSRTQRVGRWRGRESQEHFIK